MKLFVASLISLALVPLAQAGLNAPYATEAQLKDWAERRAAAGALQEEAQRLKAEANKIYLEEEKACYKKFLVNQCRAEAREREIKLQIEARAIDVDGKNQQRQVLREEMEAKDAYRLQTAQARQADAMAREAGTSEEKARLQKQVNANAPDKLIEAEERARKRIQEEADHRQRVADHERKVAEKLEKAAQKKAQEAK